MSSYLTTGQNGTLGAEWQIQNARRNQLGSYFGFAATSGNANLDFQAYLALAGIDEGAVLDQIEFNILGFDTQADGQLLSWDRSAWSESSSDDRLFQSAGRNFYTNIDFDKGTYEILDEQTMTQSLGMDWSGGKPYDVLEIVNNQINFHDFIFSGTSDGRQDSLSVDLNSLTDARWGINKYNITEVNTALADTPLKGDTESRKAHYSLDLMLGEADRWLTDNMRETLSHYKKGSSEYNQILRNFAYQVYDNEGYLEGNEIASPSEKENPEIKFNNGSQLGVVRGEDGQVLVGLKNVEDHSVGSLGAVTGDVVLSMGRTENGTNESAVQVGQVGVDSKLGVEVYGKVSNLEFYGKNIDAEINNKLSTSYNVQWNASNGSLDSSRGDSVLTVQTGVNAEDNTFRFGKSSKMEINGAKFDNAFVDSGKNNTVISAENSGNYFETTSTSERATLIGGDKENWFDIGGKDGIGIGGKSRDVFITDGNAQNNVLAGMDGDDNLLDNGTNTLFNGGKGVDSAYFNGTGAMAQMGDGEDYSVRITGGASNNQVWAGLDYSRDASNLNPEQQVYYNYRQNLEAFMARANISSEEIQKRMNLSPKAEEVIKEIEAQ